MSSLLSKIGAVTRSEAVDFEPYRYFAAACAGKKGFPTPQIAASIARRPRKEPLNHYRCKYCGLWHLGTPIK